MNFNSEMWTSLSAIALAIVGVASLAVFLSKNSNTAGVLTSAGNALATGISAATAPVTGSMDASLSSNSYGA